MFQVSIINYFLLSRKSFEKNTWYVGFRLRGDSWGQIAVPVMERYPWTSIVFVGSLTFLLLHIINLAFSIEFSIYAEATQEEVEKVAEAIDLKIKKEKRQLEKIFQQADLSGELTVEEIIITARKNPAFQSRLQVLDIDALLHSVLLTKTLSSPPPKPAWPERKLFKYQSTLTLVVSGWASSKDELN